MPVKVTGNSRLVNNDKLATPSNCGKPLKLLLPSKGRNTLMARLIASGTVKTQKILQWAIRSQVLRVFGPMNAVQRLDVGGHVYAYMCLRYSPALSERKV